MDPEVGERIRRDGFAGPLRVFDTGECQQLLRVLEADGNIPIWPKGCAAVSRNYFETATDPRLMALIRPHLGKDAILWGASFSVKGPGVAHRPHTDVESSDPDGGFMSIWIGLRNAGPTSGLKFVPGSHLYGVTAQETLSHAGPARDDGTDETVLAAARRLDPGASIVQPSVEDGDAILFDGRVWHSSINEGEGTRIALLLQYAASDRPVRIPERYDWPFQMRTDERPPVLLVSGTAPIGVNRIVLPPDSMASAVANAAYELERPSSMSDTAFASLPHFHGFTPKLDDIECHSSVLMPGACPHPPHVHPEEEILVLMAGEAELMTADTIDGVGLRHTPMRAGDFAFYPAFQPHTLRNVSSAPVLYSMLRWRNVMRGGRQGMPMALIKASELLGSDSVPGRREGGVLFEAASKWLERVHCHVSVVAPGDGYDAHSDDYDVAILLIDGAMETLDREVRAPALIFHPTGEPHGLKAAGDKAARYLVFELDGLPRGAALGRLIFRLGRVSRRVLAGMRRFASRIAPQWAHRARKQWQARLSRSS